MKFSVCTVMLPELTPEEAVKEIRNAGYEGVEWRVTHINKERQNEPPSFWGNNLCTLEPTDVDAERARSLSESSCLTIAALDAYIPIGDISATKKILRFAQISAATQIRVGIWKLRDTSYKALFKRARTFLQEIEDMTRRHGIKWLIETHQKTICPSASSTYKFVSHFDPEYVGVIFDPGNMVFEGYEDYRLSIEILGSYLAHVHLKNAAFTCPEGGGIWKARWSPMEDGVVDFPKFIAALKDAGYDGWMSMEDFSKARPCRETLRYNIKYIKNIINS